MPLNFFNMVDQIVDEKKDLDFDDPEILKAYDIYMINRYLSMVDAFIPFVNMMNRPGVSKKTHYEFFRNLIPKNKYRISYLKKETDSDTEDLLRLVCRYFEVGMREAKMYFPLLNKTHIERLKSIYSYGKSGRSFSAEE